jgi:hypothetical protein
MTTSPPPIPDAAREHLPEWGAAMRQVRSSMKSGRSTERAITLHTGLDAWTVRGALGLLELQGEVELRRDSKWRGIALTTAAYGRKTRARLKSEVEAEAEVEADE